MLIDISSMDAHCVKTYPYEIVNLMVFSTEKQAELS